MWKIKRNKRYLEARSLIRRITTLALSAFALLYPTYLAGLSGDGQAPPGGARRAEPDDHDLCAQQPRQFRQPSAGTAGRDRFSRDKGARRRDARDLHDRRRHRDLYVKARDRGVVRGQDFVAMCDFMTSSYLDV